MDANIQQRIEQWEKMVREAPDDMAWFSLGNAYKDGQRPEDAQAALAKAIELNPQMSRAYQLRGQVLIQLGRKDEAGRVLTEGYTVAAQRGDVMPQRAMGALLSEKLGLPVPQAASHAAEEPQAPIDPAKMVMDRRTGKPGHRLPDPPMRGPVGRFIYDHYSAETFREWVRQGTKVINELRLDFSKAEHQRVYDQHMMEWLGFTQDEVDDHAGKAGKA